MKKITTVLISGLLSLSNALASAPADGWYLAIQGGLMDVPKYVKETLPVSINGLASAGVISGADVATSWHAGLAIGHKSGPVRWAGEVLYGRGSGEGFTFNQTPLDDPNGLTKAYAVLGSLFYDFDELGGDISPFLGLGAGYLRAESEFTGRSPSAGIRFRENEIKLGIHMTAGLIFHVTSTSAFDLAYRYLAMLQTGRFGARFEAHLGSIGYTYRFDTA